VRIYRVSAVFHEALAKTAEQLMTVKAGKFSVAVYRALRVWERAPGIKGRRLQIVRVTAARVG